MLMNGILVVKILIATIIVVRENLQENFPTFLLVTSVLVTAAITTRAFTTRFTKDIWK